MLLYPLEEDVKKYKKKNTELLKAINEYKDNVDLTFEKFLKTLQKMALTITLNALKAL